MSLFQPIPSQDDAADRTRPLADRMRPRTLDEFVGQEHLLAAGKPLRTQIERDDTGSMIFWGPPGVGKTTLAQIIARMTRAEFIDLLDATGSPTEIPSRTRAAKSSYWKLARLVHTGRLLLAFFVPGRKRRIRLQGGAQAVS